MKRKIKVFLQDFSFVFRPNYWIVVTEYSKDVDILMNKLLDKYEFTNIGEFTAFLGDVEIWISNRPYGSMSPVFCHMALRPSRWTVRRAIKKLYTQLSEKELRLIGRRETYSKIRELIESV